MSSDGSPSICDREIRMNDEVVKWFDEIVTSETARTRDLLDPKRVILSCIPTLQSILPTPDGKNPPPYDEIVRITRSVIARLYLTAETFHDVMPSFLLRFNEGWEVDEDDEEILSRREMCIRHMQKDLFRHLQGYVDPSSLPLQCEGDCHCVVQQLPVGDRGGLPRRVPCARKEVMEIGSMRKVEISMVSISLFNFATNL